MFRIFQFKLKNKKYGKRWNTRFFSFEKLNKNKFNFRQVSQSLTAPENAEVIEATGKLVLPAGIDVHTEFSTPGSVDDFSTGTRAALAGGTATVDTFFFCDIL